jgi:hypothetical protein
VIKFNRPVLSLAASVLIALPAYAGTSTETNNAPKAADTQASGNSAAQTTADHDFGTYSHDGAKAFDDIDLARLAIFEGQTKKAAQDVQQAEAMLTKAKSDDQVFVKAEADLKVPHGTAQQGPANATPGTARIAWLPVGGMMAIDEDYTADKTKDSGVAKADAQMQQGNTKQALDTLKLHDVDVSFVEKVAPLDATLKGVQTAATLLSENHFFAANQALKGVDDGVRINVQSYEAAPDSKSASAKQ